jgi:hypothetical protein
VTSGSQLLRDDIGDLPGAPVLARDDDPDRQTGTMLP